MPEDFPIYSEAPLRTGLQFAALERMKGGDLTPAWLKADERIDALEGAAGSRAAREHLTIATRTRLMETHGILFAGRPGSGLLRRTAIQPAYRGQDCAPPEFIERSLNNLEEWLGAESFTQIHPIEQCALAMTRVIDVWPFDFGNLTIALILGNLPLRKADLAPFFVLPEHRTEFEKAVAQAMTIDMQPLINAIYQTVRKEMESLAGR